MDIKLFHPLSFFSSKVNESFLYATDKQVVSFASLLFHQALLLLEELNLCLLFFASVRIRSRRSHFVST